MNIWEILGIEPTKNKDEITKAYREKLSVTNPEDKPEEFKQLRSAYEEALAQCEGSLDGEKSKSEIWLEKLDDLYKNFSSRNQVNKWRELLDDELCHNFDSKAQVESELIHYLMDNYRISHEVMVCINDSINFMDRLDEMYESYPRDFVDHILVDKFAYDDFLQFSLFEPGVSEEECYKYLDLYLKARNSSLEDAQPIFEEMRGLSESHPFGTALMLSYGIGLGDTNLIEDLKQLTEKYEYEYHLACTLANEYYQAERYVEAEEVAKKSSEEYPDVYRLKMLIAMSMAKQGRYKEAVEVCNDLYRLVDGNQNSINQIDQVRQEWNNNLIEDYRNKLKDNPNDNQLKIDLSWALLENHLDDEFKQVARTIKLEETADLYDYYNLISNADFLEEKIDDGLEKLEKQIEILRSYGDSDDAKINRRKKRLPFMLAKKGYYIYSKDQKEEGSALFEEAISLNNSAEIMLEYARTLNVNKEYEKAREVLLRLVKAKPNFYEGHQLLAFISTKLGNDKEAYDAVNRAIDLNGNDLESYILKIKLLQRNNDVDAARDIIKFLDDNGAGEFISTRICKAYMLDVYDNQKDKALEEYIDIDTKIETEYTSMGDIFYYRYLNLIGEQLNANNKEDRETMLKLADKGLKYNEDHYGLKDYKAWLLRKDGKLEDAINLYLDLYKDRNDNDSYLEYQIGLAYYDDLDKYVEQANEYMLRAYEHSNNDALFYLGYCNFFMQKLEESEKYFMLLRENCKEKNRADVDSYYRMGQIYIMRKEYDKALEDTKIALQVAKDSKYKMNNYYYQIIQLYRIMNKPQEAIDTVKQMVEDCKITTGDKMITEICFQFGMYEEAKKYIDKRIKEKNDLSSAIKDQIQYYELNDKYAKASFKLADSSWLNEKDKLESATVIHEHYKNYKKLVNDNLKLLDIAKKEGDSLIFKYINVAESYLMLSDDVNAKEYAKLALDIIENEKYCLATMPALYYIALARINICLKEHDVASSYVKLARSSTCVNCKYCACKDADQFEVDILIQKKQYDEAIEKIKMYKDKWPEDTSYDNKLIYIKDLK